MITNRTLPARIYRRAKRLCHKPYEYVCANLFLHSVKKGKGKDDFIILVSERHGDLVYGLSYLSAIHRAYPDKRIVVVGHKCRQEILESYAGIDKLVLIDSEKWVRRLVAFMMNNRTSETGLRYGIYNSTPYYYKACYTADNPDTLFQLKTHIYGLPEDSEIDLFRVCSRDAVTAIKDFDAVKEKVVILNPYTDSASLSTMVCYEKICETLLRNGYVVYTNTVGSEKAVRGSKELHCSVPELYAIAKEIPAIVSVRSGILDYLVPSGINIFAIYDHSPKKLKQMYSLTEWGCDGKICEVYPEHPEREADQVLAEFKNFWAQLPGQGKDLA